jgi:RNA polymerase sigma-70 factor (ECF subfamily)
MTAQTPPEGPDDLELVRQYQADPAGPRGRAAAEALFRRHRDRVYHWCRRFTRDPDEALDFAQEALFTAARDLRQFEGRSAFSSWLFVVTRRSCLRKRRSKGFVFDWGTEPDQLAADAPSPETEFLLRSSEDRVLEAVNESLEDLERTALWLKCFEGASVEEITRLLRLDNVSGARSLLQKARRKLRAALERSGQWKARG